MSVLMMDLEVYNDVYAKIWKYQYNDQCDLDFCSTARQLNEDEIKGFITDLVYLNELSYNFRYREEGEPYLSEFITFKSKNNIHTLQLFKYLQAIRYQIEFDTILSGYDGTGGMRAKLNDSDFEKFCSRYKSVLDLLNKMIEEISLIIIKELTNYNNYKWS
ncbi:MAG: hypothetical protein RIC03_07045 [Cyclobacteriaceae bacterium]